MQASEDREALFGLTTLPYTLLRINAKPIDELTSDGGGGSCGFWVFVTIVQEKEAHFRDHRIWTLQVSADRTVIGGVDGVTKIKVNQIMRQQIDPRTCQVTITPEMVNNWLAPDRKFRGRSYASLLDELRRGIEFRLTRLAN